MTKNKKWWKVSVPVLLVGNVVLILMLLGSARPEEPKDASKREVRFEAVEIPEKASFAGEPLPLGRFYVKEALDRELLSNAYFHSQNDPLNQAGPPLFSDH